MPRLGELLVQDGTCDPDAIRGALRNQVIFGGRLGTNLLEMGAVTEEALAAALGKRHRLPALFGQLTLDPRAVSLLRPEIADRHDVVPYLAADRRLAVLACDPSDLAMLDEVAFATGRQVHPIVVPEARLWVLLKESYGVERQLRGIDVDFESLRRPPAAPPPAPGGPPRRDAPADLLGEREFDALYGRTGAAPLAPPAAGGSEGDDVIELTELLEDGPPLVAPASPDVLASLASLARAGGHAPPARLVLPVSPPAPPEPPPLAFDEALRALEGVTDRDAIARTVLRYARSRFRRAVLLTVSRTWAEGWVGAGDGVLPEAIRRLRLPLDAPGVVDTVVRTRAHFLGPLPKTEANVRLLKRLAGGVPGNALVVPILALGRVVNVLYADDGRGGVLDAGGVGELLILATRIAKSYETLVARVR